MQIFEDIDVFTINGTKMLTFRKETEFFISYDPTELEAYTLNEIGAEIMWLISNKTHYNDIIKYFISNYGINKEEFECDLFDFINKYRCRNLIEQDLLELGFKINEQIS
jgi:hypothetical protein